MKKIPIVEIFGPTIQGEGCLAGLKTVFVRTGGCTYRCRWCDSMYAVDAKQHSHEWRKMTPLQIGEEVMRLSATTRGPNHVTISGGDPVIHEGVGGLIGYLRRRGHKTSVETQGAFFPEHWTDFPDTFTVSPKPPSSGEEADLFMLMRYADHAEKGGSGLCVKVVVDPDDGRDWKFLREVVMFTPHDAPIYVTPCNGPDKDPREQLRKVMEQSIREMPSRVRVMPQLHVFAWGNERGR